MEDTNTENRLNEEWKHLKNNKDMEAYYAKQRKNSYAAQVISLARDLFSEYMAKENRIAFLADEARNDVIADCFENAKAFVDEAHIFYKRETKTNKKMPKEIEEIE